MEGKTNIIEAGLVEIKVDSNCGKGKATQMNDDAEPIKNI